MENYSPKIAAEKSYPSLKDATILFRYFKGELPYIASFLHHYISLSAHQFIGIVQTEQDESDLGRIFGAFKNNAGTKLNVIRMPDELPTNSCLSKVNLNSVESRARWILNVDADEFIFLKENNAFAKKEYKLFSDYIPSFCDRINLKWVMSPCSTTLWSGKGVQWNIGKDMALIQNIIDFADVHVFNTLNPSQESLKNRFERNFPIGIAHHWGRSVEDVLIKISHQKKRLKNPKNRDFTTVDDFLSINELPVRLRFMAFLESLPADIDISATDHKQLYNLEAQEKLVSKVASNQQLKKIKLLYREYVEKARDNYDSIFKHFVFEAVNSTCKIIPRLSEL